MSTLKYIKILAIFYFGLYINNAHGATYGAYTKIAGGFVHFDKIKAKCNDPTCKYENEKPNNSFSASIGLGYDFNKNISTELLGRFSIFKWDHFIDALHEDKQNITSYTLFANIYYKHPVSKKFIPYIMLGPGYAYNVSSSLRSTNKVSGTFVIHHHSPGKNTHSFAWNVGLGSRIHFKDCISLDVGYRYMSLGRIGTKRGSMGSDPESGEVRAHEIMLGLIYKFNSN